MKKSLKGSSKFVITIAIISVVLSIICAILYYWQRTEVYKNAAKIGEQAVLLMYDYGTVEQLDYQMMSLKEITTEAVFNQLTIDNEERTLNTYLKFKQDAVSVNVIKSTNTYVLYSLNTPNIASSRRFIFMFELDQNGKVCWVREVEAIDFINTIE